MNLADTLSRAVLTAVYSRGSTDAAQFRGWYHRLLWADWSAKGGPLLALRVAIKAPARAAREAIRAVRKYGAGAREISAVSRPSQLVRLWWLNFRHGVTPDTFYRYQLYQPGRWKLAPEFVQGWQAARIYRMLVAHSFKDAAELLADKRRFAEWCAERGLPTVPVLVAFDGGRVTAGDARSLPPADLFSKSAADYGGKGAARWQYVGGGRYEGDGRQWTAEELVGELATRSSHGPIVVQERQRNHHSLASITSDALGTLRVMTIRPPGEAARFLLAAYRMAVDGAVADNFSQGGIVSAVDERTGVLSAAVKMDEQRLRPVRFPTHPDSGADIAGFRLPFWSESVSLALRAHDAVGELPCVGWDVALLESGPVLLEGNWNPGVRIAQMPSGLPLGYTDYVRCLNAHLALRLRSVDPATMREYSLWEPFGRPARVWE